MDTAQRHAAALGQLLELTVLLNEDLTTSLVADGVTASRAPLLWHVGQHGPSTQRALADALGVAPRTVTGLVDALEETGFVTREPHPTDRRATLVTFTPRGRRLVAKWQRGQGEFAELLFGRMPPRRFAGLVAGLDDVLATLRAHLPPPAGGRA
jgi:DNA-binding MarR family transcriptional regulator